MRYSAAMAKFHVGGKVATARHVVLKGDVWFIQTEDSKTAEGYPTQREAVVAARKQAEKDKTDLIIHGRDGRILDVDSYRSKASASRLIPTS